VSRALAAFSSTSKRAIALGDHASQLRSNSPECAGLCDDMMRAAVVLSVAAMDTYFTRKFAEVLVPYLKKKKTPPARLVNLLHQAGLDTEQALVIIGMDRPYARIGSLMRAHLSRYTTQHFDKIDELFVCLGIADLCKHAEAKAKKKKLRGVVRALVQRRHEIAHEGDLNGHDKLQAVDAAQLLRRMRSLDLFVENADAIIENAVKSSGKKRKAVKTAK